MLNIYIKNRGRIFSSNAYNQNAIKNHEVKVDVQKRGLKVFTINKKLTINGLVSFNLYVLIHCCHMMMVINDFHVYSCIVSYMS